MLRRAVYEYTQLGGQVNWLRHRREGERIVGETLTQGVLADLQDRLEELGLPVTLRMFGVSSVREITEEIEAVTADEDDDPPKLTADQAKRLGRAMDQIHTTLIAEASGVFAYVITDKRSPSETLLDDIGRLFDEGVYEALPEIAQRDLANAGRAIALEMPTAAVFHLMRSLEAVLNDVYCHYVKRNRMSEPRNWKRMIDQMRAKKTNQPPAPLLDHFDHIRENFRNPTQHPDAEYDMNSAQNLLGVTVDALDRAVAAMQE